MKYRDLFSCSGKIAVVTGGCGLLGREISMGLSEFGATVYVADINEQRLSECADNLAMRPVILDITSEDSVLEAMNSVIREAGRIDILVNSAYPRTKDWELRLEDVPFGSWQTNVTGHLGGYFLCSRKIAEQMVKQRSGSIINLASIYGVVAPDFTVYKDTTMTMPVAYAAIKGGNNCHD